MLIVRKLANNLRKIFYVTMDQGKEQPLFSVRGGGFYSLAGYQLYKEAH